MVLSDTEVSNIMKGFPNIKLSYENIVHKKVYDSDFMITIPEGKKYFAWFSIYKNQNVCYLLEIESNKGISSIKIASACFNDELCYGIGTILYGTIFMNNNNKVFSIQDIFYYKGKQVTSTNEKFKIYEYLFIADIKQVVYSSQFILFGLPLISNNFSDLVKKIELLPYPVQYIQYRYLKKPEIYNVKYVKPNSQYVSRTDNTTNRGKQREYVFKVKAELQNDIYNLYVYSKETGTSEYLYETAYIPDYKTSVMMNKLFRKIKENDNLDALEESDSEEEFENERIDKFVFLEKVLYMVCTYNNKFRKWVPLRLANKDEKLVEISTLS
uniref:mRNA capping enzyme adenylation domain-containing protein n=1 Tax=viral metagenome TaxID=1070528 RepID=A0A6C0DTB9_9ZZZZ